LTGENRPRPDPAARLAAALETIRSLAKPEQAAELNEARETIIQLRNAMRNRGGPIYEGLEFTHDEGVIMAALLSDPGIVSSEILEDRLDLMSLRGTTHTIANLKVTMFRLRRKLEICHILIDTVWGQGYAMSPENKDKLKARRRV
jgi:DNA-binding response OmpR family regulator